MQFHWVLVSDNRDFTSPTFSVVQKLVSTSALAHSRDASARAPRSGASAIPFRRHRPRRIPLFQHGAHSSGLLVQDRAHGGGDVARR